MEAQVVLHHRIRPVSITIHTILDGTSFIKRWITLKNVGSNPLPISRARTWGGQLAQVPKPIQQDILSDVSWNNPFHLGSFTSSEALTEGSFHWNPIPDGYTSFGSNRGRSGWGHPFAIMHNNCTGENCIMVLAWSGNWDIHFYNTHEPTSRPGTPQHLFVDMGLSGVAPVVVLAPEEQIAMPAVHIGFVHGELDACVHAMHTHIRKSVLLPQPKGKQHRIEVNHTGYTKNRQLTRSQLFQEIDVAAAIRAELFIVDAGWYGEADHSWQEAVGDWDRENPLLEGQLAAAFQYAKEKGLHVGLWVEAERVGSASRVVHDHPEWLMTRNGMPIMNLDLTQSEVSTYIENTICSLIERYELDCFRLDYNISIGEGGDRMHLGYTENLLWRYYHQLYALFERIHARYPHVLLENCSSGGGRTDWGMMSRFHYTQTSDQWSPADTLKIVNGMSIPLTPEQCMTLLGAISDGMVDLDFLLRIGMFGRFCLSGIFPSVEAIHKGSLSQWKHAVDLYKEHIRPILSSSRIFHHTPKQTLNQSGDWVILEIMDEDQTMGYLGVFALAEAQTDHIMIFPRGVRRDYCYQVTFDSEQSIIHMTGDTILTQGIRVLLTGALSSELIFFQVEQPTQ